MTTLIFHPLEKCGPSPMAPSLHLKRRTRALSRFVASFFPRHPTRSSFDFPLLLLPLKFSCAHAQYNSNFATLLRTPRYIRQVMPHSVFGYQQNRVYEQRAIPGGDSFENIIVFLNRIMPKTARFGGSKKAHSCLFFPSDLKVV